MPQVYENADAPACYAVEFEDGKRRVSGPGTPSFTISVSGEDDLDRVWNADDYSAAMAFVRGKFDISGDIIAALRAKRDSGKRHFSSVLWALAARIAPARLETWFQSHKRAADNIRFHYDCSNEFYSQFLDTRMVYSSAVFEDARWTLERAQLAKLDGICRKLDLHAGERFLDVGCGWGALVIHAAGQYGVRATGCTLSHNQFEFAQAASSACRAEIREIDYRNLAGRFQKIASVGMFEHVGRHRLGEYFRRIHGLLEDDGLFLNSGITRPQPVADGADTYFLQREVFPGGELAHLSDVLREAENAGFEVLELENLRMHYARTCREWVQRLQKNAQACIRIVGGKTYRVWLLYLAASAVSFEDGQTDVYQILMSKRGSRRQLTQPV